MSLFKIKLLLLLFLVINASLAAAGINGSAALDLGLSWYQFRGPSNSLYEEEKLFSLPGADFDISIPLGKKIYLNFSELFANNLNSELNNEITAEYLQELKPNSSLAVLFSHTYEKTASSTNETNTYQDEAPCNDLLAEININLNHSENYSLYAGLQHEYKKYTRIKSNSSLEDILNPGFDLNFIRSFNKYNLLTTELQADMQFKKGYSNNAFVKDTLDAELAVEYEHNFILGGSVAAAAGVKQYYSFIYNYDRYLTFTLENKLEKDFAFDHQLGYDLTLERKQTTFSYLNNPENDSTWALIFYPEVKFNFGKYFFLDITPAVEAEKYDAATNRDYNYYQLTGEAGLGFKASRKFRIEVVPGVSRQTYYDFFISNNITTNQVITEISNTAFGSITNTYTNSAPSLPGNATTLSLTIPVSWQPAENLAFTYDFTLDKIIYQYSDPSLQNQPHGGQYFDELSMSHTLSFYYYISRHWSLESYLLFTDRYTDDDSGTGSDIEASFTTRYSF